MDIKILNSSSFTTSPCFSPFITHHKLNSSSLNFKIFSSSQHQLNSVSLRQPNYNKPTIIPSPEQLDTSSVNSIDKNSSVDVLRLFDGLEIVVTPDIYASLVAECTRNRDGFQGSEIYAHMKGNRRMVKYLKGSYGLLLFNRILLMFVICGRLDVAHQVFDEMPQRNSVSLSVLIAALVDNELFEECLCLFAERYECCMYQGSYKALDVVVGCVLKACVSRKNVTLGRMVHGWLIKMGYGNELFIAKAFIEFYGRCRCLSESNLMFRQHVQMNEDCDTSLWTCAVVNNCRLGNYCETIRIVLQMGRAGVTMNETTLSSVLRACGRVNDRSLGQQLHANAIKHALSSHVFVMCGLADMYRRCRQLTDARKVFNRIDRSRRSYACWDSMVNGLIEHGMWVEAIKMVYEMKAVGLEPKQSLVSEVRISCGTENLEMNFNGDYLRRDSI